MITVSKNSTLYKVYNTLAKTMLFRPVTPLDWKEDTAAFRDLCTFLRTTLFYIFISLPSWFLFLYAIYSVVYEAIVSAVTLEVQVTTHIVFFLLGLATFFGILFLGLFYLFKLFGYLTDKTGNSDFIELITEAVKSKHDKLCKIIKVVDKK